MASGCLFGLAYGDALGAPTEFLTVDEIVRRYGAGGPRDLSAKPNNQEIIHDRTGSADQDQFRRFHPTDPDAFETAYPDQLALARKLPGLIRMQTSKVWPKEDGSPTPAYRLLDLYFTDYAAASAAAGRQAPLSALPSNTPPEG